MKIIRLNGSMIIDIKLKSSSPFLFNLTVAINSPSKTMVAKATTVQNIIVLCISSPAFKTYFYSGIQPLAESNRDKPMRLLKFNDWMHWLLQNGFILYGLNSSIHCSCQRLASRRKLTSRKRQIS